MDSVFYLGCMREAGHYLWNTKGMRLHHSSHPDVPADFPTRIDILDGGLIPPKRCYAPEGHAFLAHVNGWTILSFNDSSVDKRPGSHSVFVVRGVKSFEDALTGAREAFPAIFARFKFEVVPAPAQAGAAPPAA